MGKRLKGQQVFIEHEISRAEGRKIEEKLAADLGISSPHGISWDKKEGNTHKFVLRLNLTEPQVRSVWAAVKGVRI